MGRLDGNLVSPDGTKPSPDGNITKSGREKSVRMVKYELRMDIMIFQPVRREIHNLGSDFLHI